MLRLIILLLISNSTFAQSSGWTLSGDTLRYNDGNGNIIQINKTGLFLAKSDSNSIYWTKYRADSSILAIYNQLTTKAPKASPTFTGTVSGVTAAMVGLGNVDNTSNATERAASAVITNKTIGSFNYAADAGANDNYVISLSPAPASYTTGMMIVFKANTQNTTGCTINVNSLGQKTIVKRVNTTPATGDILASMLCWLVYDGTNFVLLNPIVN